MGLSVYYTSTDGDLSTLYWDIIGKNIFFQIYDLEADGEVVEEGAGGGALLPSPPLPHPSSVSKVKPGLLTVINISKQLKPSYR